VEPSELLKKLSSISEKKKEGKHSWVTSVIIFFISAIAIFVFAWVSGKNAKQLAKLKHEKNKRKAEKENLKVIMKRELNEERVLDLAIKIDNNKAKIEHIDNKIEEAARVHQKNISNINSITGWKDI
jgi:uncharacterized protein HemX